MSAKAEDVRDEVTITSSTSSCACKLFSMKTLNKSVKK